MLRGFQVDDAGLGVLMKVDKMSMATSLEVRVPFLDHRLVEFAARIPSRLKFPGLRTHAICRRAMTGILPPLVLERGKQGYSLPLKTWLRGDLYDYMTTLLNTSPLICEHFNLTEVNALIAEHSRRVRNHVLWPPSELGTLARALRRERHRRPLGGFS